jgi:diguanylate cyclase (GGDEF)-like protein/PAS domain S-box-containing protein
MIIYGIYMMDTYHSFPTLQSSFHQNIIILFIILGMILFASYYVIYKLYIQSHKQNKQYSKSQLYAEQLEGEITKIEQQDKSFELLFEKSSDGIMMLEEGAITQCNERAMEILTYKSQMEITVNHPLYGLGEIPIDGTSIYTESIKKIFSVIRFGMLQFEWLYEKPNGDQVWYHVSFTPLFLKNHHIIHVVWKDITEKIKIQKVLRKHEKELYYQANHDSLTGLTHRSFFIKKLNKSIKNTIENGTKLAVLLIDIDQFKQVNDSLGHDIADQVLVIIAKRLQGKIRESDVLCRYGGDKFTILAENIKEDKNVLALSRQILSAFSHPISLHDHTLDVSCSIGIGIGPDDTNNAADLVKFADTAMSKAKEKGRNRHEFYHGKMTDKTQ